MRSVAVFLSSCLVVTMAVVTVGAQGAAQGRGGADQGPKNLKVLPKTWSRRQVGEVMSTFTQSLGVKCDFCHAEDPNAPPPLPGRGPRLDYALDTKKEKDVSRNMIKMVMTINDDTKNLGEDADKGKEKVSCFTCHQGEKKPAFTPEGGWERGDFTLSESGPVVPARGAGPGRGGRGGN